MHIDVTLDEEGPRNPHISPEEARHAIPRVDGPQGGGPRLTLRINTD